MSIDAQTRWILDRVAEEPAFADVNAPMADIRAAYDRTFARWGPTASARTREDWTAMPFDGSQLPVLVVEPAEGPQAKGSVLFLHGGGWSLGGGIAYAPMARALAAWADARVAVLEYPLAPEHPFPAAHAAARAAYSWCAQQFGSPLALSGDSAGGTLAAALCAEPDDLPIRPRGQALFYPVLDVRSDAAYRSRDQLGDGRYFLTAEAIEAAIVAYGVPEDARNSPELSPVLTRRFDQIPRTFLLLPEYDPLVDEGYAYADAARSAGVDVTLFEAAATIHGCVSFGGVIETGAAGLRAAAEFIRGVFQSSGTRDTPFAA